MTTHLQETVDQWAEDVDASGVYRGENDAYRYAVNLLLALRDKHMPEATELTPLDDVLGVLTQIDNLTSAWNTRTQPLGHPIDTAPRDGADILLFWSYVYHGDQDPTCQHEIATFHEGQFCERDSMEPININTIKCWWPLPVLEGDAS